MLIAFFRIIQPVGLIMLYSICIGEIPPDIGVSNARELEKLGYETTAEGVVRALYDAIAEDNWDLFFTALAWAQLGGLAPDMVGDLKKAYALYREKLLKGPKYSTIDLMQNPGHDYLDQMLWLADAIIYTKQADNSEIRNYMKVAKDVLLTGKSKACALRVLNYGKETLLVDISPVLAAFAMTHLATLPYDGQVCEEILSGYGERMSREMLAAIASRQRESAAFRKGIGDFARSRFGVSFDELLGEQVDAKSIVASLHLDQWPYPDEGKTTGPVSAPAIDEAPAANSSAVSSAKSDAPAKESRQVSTNPNEDTPSRKDPGSTVPVTNIHPQASVRGKTMLLVIAVSSVVSVLVAALLLFLFGRKAVRR